MTDTLDIVSLHEMKQRLRVDGAFDDVDLTSMIEAARSHIEAWVGPLDEFEGAVPASLKEALKQLAAHWFEHRETAMPDPPGEVPFGFFDLIGPYRKWEF